jgi:catechol 2,3-dioxygenase-like lactoylglutathione lyase family enzyme
MIAGLTDFFHTGVVVDDMQRATAEMSKAFGFEWAEPTEILAPVRLHDGVVQAHRWVTYSIGGAHAIELIQQADGEIYVPTDGSQRLHHLGFWVDDLTAESRRLESLGMPVRMMGPAHADQPYFAFHDGMLGGLFIELLSVVRKPAIEAWRAGGKLPH